MNSLLTVITALFTQYLTLNPPVQENPSVPLSVKPSALVNYEKVKDAVAGNENFWTAPYVLADLENEEVWVWGQHAGMGVNEPLEFFVISEMSGHDYESLMISFAEPSIIHEALLKIGAEPGGSVSPETYRFWPRGTRIVAEIQWMPTGSTVPVMMPVEQSVLTNGEVMDFTPWVFTGAPMLESFENEGEMVYGPDLYSPNSIASTFNLQNTVFDLPFQGGKTQTYGTFIRNPETDAPTGQPMLLKLRKAKPGEAPSELDLALSFTGREGKLGIEGIDELKAIDLAEFGAFLNQRESEYHFLQLDFGPELSLARITTLAREMQLLEKHVNSVRVEPPLENQLFYKAFVPDPRFRNRDNRPSQPIELHLRKDGGEEPAATLMELTEVWSDAQQPAIIETRIPLENPQSFVSYLEDPEKQRPVLFVYAPPSLLHRELKSWTAPVLEQFPVVFVYLTEE